MLIMMRTDHPDTTNPIVHEHDDTNHAKNNAIHNAHDTNHNNDIRIHNTNDNDATNNSHATHTDDLRTTCIFIFLWMIRERRSHCSCANHHVQETFMFPFIDIA